MTQTSEKSVKNVSQKDIIIFQKYVKKRKVLIVNEGGTTRAMLSKTFSELGARGDFIQLASSFDEACEKIQLLSPEVVVTDFNLGAMSGLSLINLQHEKNPDLKDTLFIILTSNTSQTAIAQAAEEEVDSYILKPFTVKNLRASLVRAVIDKVNPSDYARAIERGKNALFKGDLEAAMHAFDEAIELNPKPALAYFYKGQTELVRNALNSAEEDFRKGLEFCKIHYKCLVGLFDLLMMQKKDAEAYLVVRKIATYFPSNPKRLFQILKLTVILKEFEDLVDYYEAFCNLPTRDRELTLQMCAALVVAGRFFLMKEEREKGLDFIHKAVVSSAGMPTILSESILVLCDFNEIDEAQEVLKRFAPDEQLKGPFASSVLTIRSKTDPLKEVINRGLQFLDKGIHNPQVFELVLAKLAENGSHERAESVLAQAKKEYPDHPFKL